MPLPRQGLNAKDLIITLQIAALRNPFVPIVERRGISGRVRIRQIVQIGHMRTGQQIENVQHS